MSKPHELLDPLVTWAQDPDKWQWRFYRATQCEWVDCTPWDALEFHAAGTKVAIFPKRNMIPPHLLPEGWKVERLSGGNRYSVTYNAGYHLGKECYSVGTPMGALLRHIDPEAKP